MSVPSILSRDFKLAYLLWLIPLCFCLYFFYCIRAALVPFYTALLLSYVLQMQVTCLQKYVKHRALATLIVYIVVFSIIGVLVISVAPAAFRQGLLLVKNVPVYIDYFVHMLPVQEIFTDIKEQITYNDAGKDLYKYLSSSIVEIANKVWSSGSVFIGKLIYLFLVPVITFYITKDWDRLVKKVALLIPKDYKSLIFEYCSEVDHVLRRYIVGQIEVCIILGFYYSISLTVFGLRYGLLLGIVGGVLSFIPYVGSGIVFVFGNLIAFFQFSNVLMVLYTNLIIILGQVFEGYFITPRVMSHSIHLNPVWIIFAVVSGASFSGIAGVILAIPVAAIIRVTIVFLLRTYPENNS